jgi:hypothetical protein
LDKLNETNSLPEGLECLCEKCPVIKVYIELLYKEEDEGIVQQDYWQVRYDDDDDDGGGGGGGGGGVDGDENNNRNSNNRKSKKFRVNGSWLHIDFQGYKYNNNPNNKNNIPVVITVEADDDFVIPPKNQTNQTNQTQGSSNAGGHFKLRNVYTVKSVRDSVKVSLKEKVIENFLLVFPEFKNRIVKSNISNVIRTGLSDSPYRYAAIAACRPSTPLSNLFLSGNDITDDTFLGGFDAACITGNEILGYNCFDLGVLDKNCVSDLVRDGSVGVEIVESFLWKEEEDDGDDDKKKSD